MVVSERIAETCRRLGCTEAPLTSVFIEHAEDQCQAELPDKPWPNLQSYRWVRRRWRGW